MFASRRMLRTGRMALIFMVIAVYNITIAIVLVVAFDASSHRHDGRSIRRSITNDQFQIQFSKPLCAAKGDYQSNGANERRNQSLERGHNPLISLNLNLDSLAQRGAAPRAQELLQRIRALHQEGYYEVSPDTVSYNTVLKAWKETDNPDKAYELLQGMLESQDFVQANVISFNTVILAFARQGNYTQAVKLLRLMEDKGGVLRPDVVTYNAVLYAFAQSRDQGVATQAERLLKHMLDPHKSTIIVDTTSFNTVIYAWAQVAGPRSLAPAQRAQSLFEHMATLNKSGNARVNPDIYTYNTVIQAWAKSQRPDKAYVILNQMLQNEKHITPNRFTYTAVMSSLAKSGQPERAQEILDDMMHAYSQGNFDLKPDTVAFSCVIDGWAKKSSVEFPEAAEKAMELLEQMKKMEDQGMGPNARTYTSILTAVAKSGRWDACGAALDLVEEMDHDFNDGKIELRPTNIHWNAVLNAYARSPHADKALKAEKVLKIMKQHPRKECHPDIISYNSLLMACANAFGNDELKEQSFQIALEVFRTTIASYSSDANSLANRRAAINRGSTKLLEPTSTTFAHFCKSARRLLRPPKRSHALTEIFQLCCSKGLVNEAVLQQVVMSNLSDDDWEKMLGEHGHILSEIGDAKKLQFSHLPKEFVRNARR